MRTSERLRHALGVALLALAGAATALPAGVPWTTLPAADRERLTARAARLQAMSPAERAAFAARVAAWHALPAQERERRRIAFAAIEAMPHPERARLQQAAAHFDTLPDEARQALRLQFDQLDLGLRRGWLLGPTLGAEWPGLHALFAAMPAEQHAPAMLALRAASPQARADLAVLAQRTPPQERDALRAQWLAVAPGARDAWLRARVDP